MYWSVSAVRMAGGIPSVVLNVIMTTVVFFVSVILGVIYFGLSLSLHLANRYVVMNIYLCKHGYCHEN